MALQCGSPPRLSVRLLRVLTVHLAVQCRGSRRSRRPALCEGRTPTASLSVRYISRPVASPHAPTHAAASRSKQSGSSKGKGGCRSRLVQQVKKESEAAQTSFAPVFTLRSPSSHTAPCYDDVEDAALLNHSIPRRTLRLAISQLASSHPCPWYALDSQHILICPRLRASKRACLTSSSPPNSPFAPNGRPPAQQARLCLPK